MKSGKIFLSTLYILFAINASAEVAQSKSDGLDYRINMAKPKLPPTEAQISTPKRENISMSSAELQQHPDLIIRGLVPAVLQNNAKAVEILLPFYKNLPNQDPTLLAWSESILARHQGNFSLAAERYRTLFSQHSHIIALRYQLAQALFLNNDNEAAKDQFQKLRAEDISQESIQIIDQYLSALNKRNQWKVNGGISYLNESNINNAPKSGTKIGNWNAWEKESAQGFSYYLNGEKKWSWANNVFTKLQLEGQGRYFWNNRKYNELNLRVGAGLGYQTARFENLLTPFTEKRWYGGGSSGGESLKQYAKNSGIRLETNYWLNEKWQISTALEYGEQRYNWRKHLNGNNYLWSNTLLYTPQSGQYWLIGIDYNRENTRDHDNAYQRKNIRLAWGQEWSLGISSRLNLAYARRTYKDIDFFQIRQKNNEYFTALTLWHRDFYFLGITPKLTWTYQKIKSNHPFYRYDKNRVYLEMSKIF
ncbi:surface lipoprotein assembly modifier [Rodentibacter pneumotropicus]